MKGISHFISGVAAATFVPSLVHMSAEGSFVLLMAGVGGLMPDTLDFKLARYLERAEVNVDPDPKALDPQSIADEVAAAVNRAYKSGRPVRVQLHTMQLGADRWRRYQVRFGEREVQVHIGPVVTTSGLAYPDTTPGMPTGRAETDAPTRYEYDAAIRVDIFSGPMLEFRRRGEAVEITFLPWHRRWSHSLTLAALVGGVIALLLGPLYGLAYALGAATHILEDQLGHMGSNLFYPFTRERTPGLRLFHSGDALPNLFAVWLSVVLILFNLDRFAPTPLLNPWSYFATALLIPWAAILGLTWWSRRRSAHTMPIGDVRIAEIQAEAEETET